MNEEYRDNSSEAKNGAVAETTGNRRIYGAEPMRYATAYLFLILASTIDIILTARILSIGGGEINPFAQRVIQNHGPWGMILYKFALMVFFIILCEEIGRRRPAIGRRMARVAVGISSIPILWGLILLSIG